MSSIFSGLPLWRGDHCYVTAQADFLHQQIDKEMPHGPVYGACAKEL